MSKLSPAAQAVLDAANGAQSHGPDDCLNESRWVAAAALRAVIETCAHTDFGDHWVIPASDLERIADEIEAQ